MNTRYTVDPIGDHGFGITERGGFQLFLVTGSDESLLIDTGLGTGDLRRLVSTLTDVPVTVLLTHSHLDHIGAASQFDHLLLHPTERTPGGEVTLDGLSEAFELRLEDVVAGLQADPDAADPPTVDIQPEPVSRVRGGDHIDLGDRHLRVYHAPGHSPGHSIVLDPDARLLYGGDLVGRDRRILAHLPGASLGAYLQSIQFVEELFRSDQFDTLLTSHNAAFERSDLEILSRMTDALHAILDDDATYDLFRSPWGPARCYEFDDFSVITSVDQ